MGPASISDVFCMQGMHECSLIRSLLAVHELALVVIHNAVRRTLAKVCTCSRRLLNRVLGVPKTFMPF